VCLQHTQLTGFTLSKVRNRMDAMRPARQEVAYTVIDDAPTKKIQY